MNVKESNFDRITFNMVTLSVILSIGYENSPVGNFEYTNNSVL